ncbi:MAG: DNA polymerase III subunit delta' [Pseudomonadota bacterium]
MSFPWLREPWLRIVKSAKQRGLSHAYYMRHAPDRGSEQFLLTLANYLLCQQPTNSACGKCKSCLLFKAGNHPDYWPVDGTDASSIGIDQMRQIQQKLTQTANQGGARVVVLRPAEKLTEQAANAILKVLEEPPEEMFWLLAVEQPEHLLPTLRSRMQWINLNLPGVASNSEQDEQAASLLRTVMGNALPPVMKKKEEGLEWLNISEKLLLDVAKSQHHIASQKYNYPALAEQYRQLHQQRRISMQMLNQAVADSRQLRQKYQHSKGLNLPLLLSFYWQQWAIHVFDSNTGSGF